MLPLKTLVVEDEEWVRRGMLKRMSMLGDLACVSAEAGNCQEALAQARKVAHLDVLLTDIRLPDGSGLDIIAPIKEQHAGLKVIIISGYSEFDYAQRAIRLGVNGYLLKPVKEEELRKVMEECAAASLGLATARLPGQSKGAETIYAVRDFIRDNVSAALSLTAISERFGISASYMSRLFKAICGESISDYIVRVRIEAAHTLLAQTSLSISAIAELLNFTDASHLSHAFQKQTGMPPSVYRKRQRSIGGYEENMAD